jgi:hypothetical protein
MGIDGFGDHERDFELVVDLGAHLKRVSQRSV